LGLLAVFEIAFPRRFLGARLARWRTNFLLGGANMFLLRVILPGGLVALAYTGYGGGVFGWLELPLWVEIFISLIILDFVIYAQHMALHHIPFLWPLHATHHAEQTLDVSSGLRFHPGEALVSLGVKAVAVLALGVHPAAVIIFEILLSSTSLFSTLVAGTPACRHYSCRPTCTASTIRAPPMKAAPISASACQCGTRFSKPIAQPRTRPTKRCRSV
jgi:sterol desaturase/sphingolipid hydroxylase (fatty acid hydroxylase superfamily)